MSHQIIKQPDGKYCVFSTIVDDIIWYDCTKEDLIGEYIRKETKKIEDIINGICNKLDNNEKPYFQFTMTLESALDTIKRKHGKKRYNQAKDCAIKKEN